MKIRNSIVAVLFLMLISTASFAQFGLGIRQGIAVSTFADKGDICDNTNVTLSYTAGAFISVPLNKSLAIQPELNYIRKGRSNETTELNTTFETDLKNNYLQVPVLLQYRDARSFGKTGSAFYVNGGPYAGFVLNTKTHVSGGNGGIPVTLADSKKTDWGATLGIGYQTPVYKKDIRFDLRYDMGLSEIANQPSDYRTKALSLTIGILF
jgi:hypothetical protein